MNRFHIYAILLISVFLNLTVTNYIKLFGAKPDMVVLSVVFVGLFLGKGKGLEAGIAGGFLKDLFTLDTFGMNTSILGLTGLAAGALSLAFFRESKSTQALLVLIFTVFSMALTFFMLPLFLKSPGINFLDYFLTSVLPSGVYTALVSVPVYSLFVNLYKFKEDSELL